MQCYLCQNHTAPFLRKNGYTIYRCSTCGLGITDLKETNESFVYELYDKGFFTGSQKRGAYVNYKEDKPYIVKNMRKFLREIQKIKPTGKLLDVGCAMGFFVELASAAGYNAYGFDPSDYAVREAKKNLNGRIAWGTVKEVQYLPQSFDIITLFDVFEHLADPVADLRKLAALLKNDGIIVIATGDSASPMAKIMNSHWTFYNPPQHLFYFDKSSLGNLLQQENLIPVTWFRINKWLSLRYVLHLARTAGKSKLGAWLYQHLAESAMGKFPLYLPVRDNMVVIARKRV